MNYDEYDDCPETAPKIKSTINHNAAAVRAMRKSREYNVARDQFRIRAKNVHNKDGSKGQPCWLCGQPIDYRLKYPHPRSWTVDHAIPIKENFGLMLNPANFRSAHLDCNMYRGTDAPRIDLGVPSEIW
jgi:hypothetical protein